MFDALDYELLIIDELVEFFGKLLNVYEHLKNLNSAIIGILL
jgi:hypothetical protein